ncbi:MAG: hypothetical protein LBE67_12870 [Kocuria palustris]|nr:hypothetical protein [Kocuria palustris]
MSAQHCHFLLGQRQASFVMVFLLDYANMNPIQILNVEIPFYFKNIVDSMNVDFAAIGGTAYTVAGSMIIACEDFSISKC